MIEDYTEKLIFETIPPKKYSTEWNADLLNEKMKEVFDLSLPINDWFEEEGVDEEEIKKRIHYEISQKYEEKHKYSLDLLKFAEKRVMLFQIDKDWRDHLAAMDSLRGSVNLRAMGGKDPFYEYKRESFDYFDELLSNQNEKVLKTLFNMKLLSEENKNKTVNQNDNERRIVSKKSVEMNHVLVDQEKNINNVMEIKFLM